MILHDNAKTEGPSFYCVSLGCSKNLVDTEVMLAALRRVGVELVDDPAQADALLVNTCAFLTEAVEEALEKIVELAEHKKTGKAKRLVVAGCLVSRYGEQLLEEVPEIDALVHPREMGSVAEAVLGKRVADDTVGLPFLPRALATPPHRAYLKIAEGCANRCAYCLIPSLRGGFVSRPPFSVAAEFRSLVEGGAREVTLICQDSTRYGTDRAEVEGRQGLPALLRTLLKTPGDFWLRVLYTHPARVSDDLLDALAADPRACRYLDIPFQHSHPSVLARMNRADTPDPLPLLARVRERLPGVALRTTLMVGFPGETEEDFSHLLSFVEEARFDHLGAFVWSPEEGTAAESLPDRVDEEEAKERLDRLMMLQGEVSAEKLEALVGWEVTVLSEGADDEGVPYGRHQGQAPEVDGVVELDRPVPAGEFVRVRITASEVHDLKGEVKGSGLEL